MSAPDPIRAIADAVLYEGYVLWPYRRSALKNTHRWTFGGVYPRAHAEARAAGDDPWTMQTQCLVEATGATPVSVALRFLHVVRRQVLDAQGAACDELTLGSERHLTWDEAREREVRLAPVALDELADGRRIAIEIAAGFEHEALEDAGAVVRSWEGLRGALHVSAEPVGPTLHRVTARVENETPWAGGSREAALRHTLCSAHTILRTQAGAFVSLTDPPPALARAAAACENQGTWPVLVGEAGQADTLLSSPIILEDHPRIAPESPGDLFDGGEIDQMLILNVLQLTDAEKAEARASDPRVRALVERCEALSPAELLRLNGRTTRELWSR